MELLRDGKDWHGADPDNVRASRVMATHRCIMAEPYHKTTGKENHADALASRPHRPLSETCADVSPYVSMNQFAALRK